MFRLIRYIDYGSGLEDVGKFRGWQDAYLRIFQEMREEDINFISPKDEQSILINLILNDEITEYSDFGIIFTADKVVSDYNGHCEWLIVEL